MQNVDHISIECELHYKNIEDFVQNRNMGIHIDKFSKTVSSCSNVGWVHCSVYTFPKLSNKYIVGQNIHFSVLSR